MAKFRIELEQTDWQMVLQLVNAGGQLANMAPVLISKISEQFKAGPVVELAKPNGADAPQDQAHGG